MGMGLKTFTRGYPVIVQYPQSTEMNPFGIVIFVKAETVMAVEPVIYGSSAGI